MPCSPAARAVTSTRVVESQAMVPSDSGASVGIVYAWASSVSTGSEVCCLLMPATYPDRWHRETVCGEQGGHGSGAVLRHLGRRGGPGRAEHRLRGGAPAARGQPPAQ